MTSVLCHNVRCINTEHDHTNILTLMTATQQGWWVNVNPVFTRWSQTPRPGRCWNGLTPPPTGVNPLY